VQPFGDGIRCAAGTVIRLGVTTSSSGVANRPRPGDAPIGVAGAIPAIGASRILQVWYGNADPTFSTASTFNLPNSVVVNCFQ
jgi:hypothetical protein